MCTNIYLTEIQTIRSIYFTCPIKPKHAQHTKIPIFAKIHVLLVQNFYTAQKKSKIKIWKYMSLKSLKFSRWIWQELGQKTKLMVSRFANIASKGNVGSHFFKNSPLCLLLTLFCLFFYCKIIQTNQITSF